MIKLSILLAINLLFSLTSPMQSTATTDCDVEIKVLDGRYMHAKALTSSEVLKKTKVVFNENLVSVYVPQAEGSILLNIENSNCAAYCSKAKRVRQLNKGDEKLLRNLIDKEMLNIMSQVNACK